MIRSIALAAGLGALVAAETLCAAAQSPWRNAVAGWLGTAEPVTEAKIAPDAWPICTTMGAMGSEADWAQLDPDFAAGKKALVAEDWNAAIAALKLPHCATRATPTSRTISAMPIAGCARWGRRCSITSRR